MLSAPYRESNVDAVAAVVVDAVAAAEAAPFNPCNTLVTLLLHFHPYTLTLTLLPCGPPAPLHPYRQQF